MAKLIALLITVSFLLFTPVAQADERTFVETAPGKIRNTELKILPAWQVDNFKKICGIQVITEERTIADLVGHARVSRFIAGNKLDPKTTNANTLLPVGNLVTVRKI
jgi:hypothetical protein